MPKTLLLADDSVTIQKVVGITFANEDIHLVTVDNGDEALIRAREVRPDLVLADVAMPGLSGYELCQAIRRDAALARTPVLLLTGTFESFDAHRAEEVGANGHIAKPFEAQALIDKVHELLDQAETATPLPAEGPVFTGPASTGAERELGDRTPTGGRVETPSQESALRTEAPESGADTDLPSELIFQADEPPARGPDATPPSVPVLHREEPRSGGPAEPPVPEMNKPAQPGGSWPEGSEISLEELADCYASPSTGASEASTDDSPPLAALVDRPSSAPPVYPDLGDSLPDSFSAAEDPAAEAAPPEPSSDAPVAPAAELPVDPTPGTEDLAAGEELEPTPVGEPRTATGGSLSGADPLFEGTFGPQDPGPPSFGVPEESEDPELLDSHHSDEEIDAEYDGSAPSEGAVAQSDHGDLTWQTSAVPVDPEQLRQALEKVAWESFGSISEEVVRAVVRRVEAIAWEVIPAMAERLILEEIARLKQEPPGE
jgi:CheY-like chemotaxis protein